MRIQLQTLSAKLERGPAPLYHLFGAETLLLEEAADAIRQAARAHGFTERIRYSAEAGFDWNQLFTSGQSGSLFAAKKLIELRMPTGKPGDAGGKALLQYAESALHEDTILLVIGGAIDKRAQTAKWFKKLETAGVAVECPAIPAVKLAGWISGRMRAKNLKFEPPAAARLAHFVEGNLLAAAQAVDLLALLYPAQTITPQAVENTVADHARFTVYALGDACLAGEAARATRILQGLRRNQAEPILILWALAREVRALCQLQAGLARGEPSQALFKRYGIWSSRNHLISAALRRLPRRRCEYILRQLAHADLMLKGRAPLQRQNIWLEIENIGLQLCGVNIGQTRR